MKVKHWEKGIAVAALILAWAGTAAAATDAGKCEADKLKRTGKYAFCRMKADSNAIKTGQPADYMKCDQKITDKFGAAETAYGVACRTSGDVADIQSQAMADMDFLALKLSGVRFVENGDGTVTDVETGLMWEQKDHDVSRDAEHDTSADGTTISGCFADHCDWRLPTSAELQTILLAPYPCGTNPCIDPIFGPTQSTFYWSATTSAGNAFVAWGVNFINGFVVAGSKPLDYYVRAVRGGL